MIQSGKRLFIKIYPIISIRSEKNVYSNSKMGFFFDIKCFFGTITSVLKHEGVVEGGTGEMKKQESEKEEAEV